MIYELAVVAKSNLTETDLTKLCEIVKEVVTNHEGDVFVEDHWGNLSLPQATSKGVTTGKFLYFIYRANSKNNAELCRRFKINEGVLKSLIVKLGKDETKEALLKDLKIPYSKNYPGSVADEEEDQDSGGGKDSRKFSRHRSCWFTDRKIKADWKDPKTFSWLINEFGKISPARISGINRKHQNLVNLAIKRSRQIGISSYLSNRFAE